MFKNTKTNKLLDRFGLEWVGTGGLKYKMLDLDRSYGF